MKGIMMMKEKLQMYTPWGWSQHQTHRAEGVVFHSTSGHGGYHLSNERADEFYKAIPEFKTFCGMPNWFEEHCDADAIVLVFAKYYPDNAIWSAVRSTRRYSKTNSCVLEFLEKHPELLEIFNKFEQSVVDLWEASSRCTTKMPGIWSVHMRRGDDRKWIDMPYPEKQHYTDEELTTFKVSEEDE